MNYQEFVEKFDNVWPRFKEVLTYEKFDDLPVELKVPEALFVWVFDTADRIKEIPLEFVDHDIRLAAVWNSGATIEFISKKDTDRYEELALCAVSSNPDSLHKIDPSVFSDDFFIKAITSRSDVVFHFRKVLDKGYKLSSEIISAVLEHAITAISSLVSVEGFADLATDEMVRRGVLTSFVDQYAWWIDLRSLELIGKTSVVQEAISSGFWPVTFRFDSDEPYFPDVLRPASLPEAILAYSQSNENYTELFKFSVLSYGTDEVISSLHLTSAGLDTLQTLYTDKELVQYAKKYIGLRGRFLENALGM
jgi:hypothetical protein